MSFPQNFLWGAATAACQIEGAYDADGRGPSIWDVLYPGHTFQNEHPHEADDHYHHVDEDIALMKQIGIKSYRFSVSWSRILPDGTGKVNEKGIAFYQQLVSKLKDAGIEPLVTLFHWDLPLSLYHRGGWLNPEISDWFEDYTRIVVEALSDKVQYWMTLNEPQCFIGLGYDVGVNAPFIQQPAELPLLTKNTILSHGKAVRAIRKYAKLPPKIGMANCGTTMEPMGTSPEAIEEARFNTFEHPEKPFDISWFCDPIFLGKIPETMQKKYGDAILLTDEEMALVSQKLDFFGINKYSSEGTGPDGVMPRNGYVGQPITTMDWPVVDDTLYWAARFCYERYQLPIMVTENGMANTDWVMLDGKVHDPQRIDYTHRYLKGLKRACEENIPVLGYQYWSLMDNYEWSMGYSRRFGIIYVDYRTQKRTLKDSALWYHDVIAQNGENI